MSGEDRMKGDIHKLSQGLAQGLSGTTVLIEQASTNIAAVGARLDQHTREAHVRDLAVNRELGELKAQLASIDKMLTNMVNVTERIAKLETGYEKDMQHVRADITGKHDLVGELAKSTIESVDKKDARDLEETKLKHVLEEKRLAGEHRRQQFQFWGAIAVVALPGLIALFWHLLGLPGAPPTIPSPHEGAP